MYFIRKVGIMDIESIRSLQKEYFQSGATRKPECRIAALENLKKAICDNENELNEAIYEDLGKSPYETYMTETGLVLDEISYMIDHISDLSRRKYSFAPLTVAPADCYSLAEPYGNVLIIGSWNYPLNLTLIPLVDALAAGNTAIIKVSAYAPATGAALQSIISRYLPPQYVAVVEGGREVNCRLLDMEFDLIFFTGSKEMGRFVLSKAAPHLTPVVLELGGKCPCVVDASANIEVAARRIVFGKFLNAGQTCVAPDYVLVENSVKELFLNALADEIHRQFGKLPLENVDYGKIVNDKHFQRILSLMQGQEIWLGGQYDEASRRLEPTVILDPALDSPLMRQEIFGPLLPVIGFDDIAGVPEIISLNPDPLALYLFSVNRITRELIFENIRFGGGCINDTVMHMAGNKLGFGGVGSSGMGAYHGKTGFYTFSHVKSVLEKPNIAENSIRYQPYNAKKEKTLRRFLK